jgi:signal transduction histidine kinase
LGALRATPLEDMGLAEAVDQLAETAAARGGLSLHLDIGKSLGSLLPEVEQCYYRVAQEAVENVVKHAQARSMRVTLVKREGVLLLEVADDGSGLEGKALEKGTVRPGRQDPVRAVEGASQAIRFGIKGMQERAELIDAALEVESAEGKGTLVRLSLKVNADGMPVSRVNV